MPIIDTPTLFGRCIAVLRRALDLTQAEFGTRVGLTREGITRVEAGRATLTFFSLVRVSDRLGKEDRAAAELFEFFELCIEEMNERGFRVLNRPRRPGDRLLPIARVDRIVAHVYEELLDEYLEALRERDYDIADDDYVDEDDDDDDDD